MQCAPATRISNEQATRTSDQEAVVRSINQHVGRTKLKLAYQCLQILTHVRRSHRLTGLENISTMGSRSTQLQNKSRVAGVLQTNLGRAGDKAHNLSHI